MKQKQLEHFTTFQKDPVIINGFVTGFVSWLVSTVVLIWSYKDLPVVVPLFYSLSRGQSQLADKPFIFVLPILSIVFFVTHLIFAWIQYAQDMVFSRVMALSASVEVFMFTVALGHILWITL